MDKMIVVTGASRGIGAAIALELAGAGYTIACLSRSGGLPSGENASPQLLERCIPVAADVADEGAFRAAFAGLAKHGQAIVGLVNNAGFHIETLSATMPMDQWHEVMSANADSVVIGCQAVYPLLLANGGGLIINIGSFYDKLGVKRNLAYCASKAAVGAITRVLAVEWASKGISLINVAPGFILTDLNRKEWNDDKIRPHIESRIPGKKPGSPEDIATLVAGLYAMKRPYLTGETIYIDGGQGLVI